MFWLWTLLGFLACDKEPLLLEVDSAGDLMQVIS